MTHWGKCRDRSGPWKRKPHLLSLIYLCYSVATGVKLLKAKQIENALRYFNYALEIDAENVEAMVARGAL